MALNTVDGNLYVKGTLTAAAITIPAGAIIDTNVAVVPGGGITADKLQHRHIKQHSQPNTAATAETRFIHVARAAGSVQEIVAGSIAIAIGAAAATIDLKKNGTSILTSVLTLNSSNTARVVAVGTIATAAYVAGDWFELVITAAAGGGTLPTGLGAEVVFHEFPS